MGDEQKKIRVRMRPQEWLLRVLQGVLIGGGAILPGISGGVLCVSFGLYQPMMSMLAEPRTGIRRYGRLFLPVLIGWLAGFWGFALVIDLLFGASETLATWLFIGLIAGTMPSLFREANKEGKAGRGAWAAFAAGFAVMFAFLLFVKNGVTAQLEPNAWWFLFCGVLWGLSLVVPGMTSSSILMSMGLFEPMVTGIRAADPMVTLPMLAGVLAVVALTAKLVNYLFKRYYTVAYHAIVGIVIASTLVIVPLRYTGVWEGVFSALCCAAGYVVAWRMDEYGKKFQ